MSNPSTGRGPASRQLNFQTVPKGEILGTFDTYLEAQERVDHLAKADFPVGKVSIVGNDLKTVERVTRKLSWSRAALEGALSGAWFGLFVGLLFTLFPTTTGGVNWGLFVAAILIGAAAGLLFRLAAYGASRRSRDFDSTRQMLAANYQVIVTDGQLAAAQDALARQPAE